MAPWIEELEVSLRQLKQPTEDRWASGKDFVFDENAGVGSHSFAPDTRWREPMTDDQIDALLSDRGGALPADYRAFLRTLNGTTPQMQGARFEGPGRLKPSSRPGFYSWEHDRVWMDQAKDDVVDGLIFDVEHSGLWLEGWGPKPARPEERIRELVAGAPPLIPLFGHRHLIYVDPLAPNPVISIMQSDIIAYGLNIFEYILIEEKLSWTAKLPECRFPREELTNIPFWGELIQ